MDNTTTKVTDVYIDGKRWEGYRKTAAQDPVEDAIEQAKQAIELEITKRKANHARHE